MASALGIGLFNNQAIPLIGSASNHIVDASTEGIAWAFQSETTDPITHLGFRYGARTGTPPTYLIQLEGLDTAGLPDGTDVGGGSPTSVTFRPPDDTSIDGLWQWKALTNSYTPTRGQILAAVIRYDSVAANTIDGSNNSSFTRAMSGYGLYGGLPYHLINNAGTWVKSANGMCFGYRTVSGRYGTIVPQAYGTNTANTAGHQALMHFTLPSGHGDTYQVLGFRGGMFWGSIASTVKAVLLETNGAVLQDVTLDTDFRTTGGTATHEIIFDETTLATLSYGTKYYIGLEYVAGASGVGIRGVTLAEAEDRSAFPNGMNRGLATYDGSYVEDNTVLPLLDLILSDITVPSGGGGGGVLIGGRLVR